MAARSKARTSVQRAGAQRGRQLRLRIASDIRTAREDAGLISRRLAQLAGVSVSSLHSLEQALHDPTIETLSRLSTAGALVPPKSVALAELRKKPVVNALLLRSTQGARAIVAEYASLMATAYPARHEDALASIVGGTPFPGNAIIWCKVEGSTAILLDRPPRGIAVGR